MSCFFFFFSIATLPFPATVVLDDVVHGRREFTAAQAYNSRKVFFFLPTKRIVRAAQLAGPSLFHEFLAVLDH